MIGAPWTYTEPHSSKRCSLAWNQRTGRHSSQSARTCMSLSSGVGGQGVRPESSMEFGCRELTWIQVTVRPSSYLAPLGCWGFSICKRISSSNAVSICNMFPVESSNLRLNRNSSSFDWTLCIVTVARKCWIKWNRSVMNEDKIGTYCA